MTAQASTMAPELDEKVNLLVAKKRKPSKSDIASLKTEAGKLKEKITYPAYYDFLGRIACLENDKANMLSHYKNAITLSFNNKLIIKKNYFIGLLRCGLIFKASEQLKEIAQNFPTCAETLSFLIEQKFYLCLFRESLELITKQESESKFFNLSKRAVFIFENANLSDDDAQHLCELAYSILETKNLYYLGSTIEIVEDCIFYTIYVDAPIEEVAQIDFELSYLFAEQLEDMHDDVIIFEYKSVETMK